MAVTWKRLPLEGHESCPFLYVSYTFGSRGYEIFLTDLAHVWSESLSRKQILAYALKQDTSIDPSQDDDQYSVLLQKISDALSGKAGTTLSLRGHRNRDDLKLSTETKLPTPLEPLVWIINLTRSPQNVFTKQVFLPVIRGAANCEARTQLLIEKLKEKDWALGKLFDKLESSGINLNTVFPSLTGTRHGRKGSAFSQAAKLIKGIAPFDENTWHLQSQEQNLNAPIDETIIREIAAADSVLKLDALENSSGDWWTKTWDSDHAITSPITSRTEAANKQLTKSTEQNQNESDDEFETRETPPRLKKPSRPADAAYNNKQRAQSVGKGRINQSTGSSENEAISPIQSPPPREQVKRPKIVGTINPKASKKGSRADSTESDTPLSPKRSRTKGKGLGAIGGRKIKTPDTKKPPSGMSDASTESDIPARKDVDKPSIQEESTESEADQDLTLRPNKRQKLSPTDDEESDKSLPKPMDKAAKSRPKSGLGQIGGKKKQKKEDPKTEKGQTSQANVSDEERTHDRVEASQAPTPKPAKRQNKLGMIGGGKPSRERTATRGQDKPPITSQGDVPTADETSDGEQTKASVQRSRAKSPKRSKSPTPGIKTAPPAPKKEESITKTETPDERANRKREELRRQLESKAGPTKKKRRF
ncbi:predicted protein [Uncinocarpus reesii 1704]|uniref:Non-homologous end-joining factor 1 n=1 Tax=Uncinocarpus reesii (strain UAMH 1704) TaxID=336963 RepID=C4JJG7_UNCRE|nr:uncharacterized protein UREG_01774 [Uncinocarpus reesii 1704]EEP76925.1 predicted protein [Uncinocarpus reesii 1704]